MSDIISKELLSEVTGENINDCWLRPNGIDLQYSLIEIIPHEPLSYINIYELAHKCKEWASIKNFWIVSSLNSCDLYNFSVKEKKEPPLFFDGKTEPEVIFKACQWILDNKDKQ